MKIITIDTSNQTMVVSLCEDKKLMETVMTTNQKNHSLSLMPAIEEVTRKADISPNQIDRIAVAKGPGSYTGLRIGMTTAKTLAWTLNCELVIVSSLEVLAANLPKTESLIVPVFNARRKNVYTGAYEWKSGKLVMSIPDQHIAFSSWLTQLEKLEKNVFFVGEDIMDFEEELANWDFSFEISKEKAINLPNGIALARQGLCKEPEKDIASLTPSYLKQVEAEEKWLATQSSVETKKYIRRT